MAAPGNHDPETRDLRHHPDALAYYLYWNQSLNGPLFKEGCPTLSALKGFDSNKKAFTDVACESYPNMSNFSFDAGNAHWKIINLYQHVYISDPAIKEWVKAELEAAKNATWRFVASHHPGFNSAREHFEQQHMRSLSPLF